MNSLSVKTAILCMRECFGSAGTQGGVDETFLERGCGSGDDNQTCTQDVTLHGPSFSTL